MRPVSRLGTAEARAIDRVVFDLDDTLLDHGDLTEDAYRSLFVLREAGLELVASTGRPAGFAEVLARQWPVRAVVAENGAIAFVKEGPGRVRSVDRVAPAERAERRGKLRAIADTLAERFDLAFADDDWARRSDVALDVGERRHVPEPTVARARAEAAARGARTFLSSVHLHLTFDAFDKATGFAALAARLGEDPACAVARAAFVGDSANDAAAFAAFGLTFAVANVRPWLRSLTVLPRYVAEQSMGRGFAEIAAVIAARRGEAIHGASR